MFDVDKAIADWRQQMLTAGIKSPVPLEELESHLRDDIEQQIRSGVDVQQAFEAAVEQLGQADRLTKEFAKDPFAYSWKVGNLIIMVMAGLSFLFERFLLLDYGNPGSAERIASYSIIILTTLFLAGQLHIVRFLYRTFTLKRLRTLGVRGMTGAGLLWFTIMATVVVANGGFHGQVPSLGRTSCFACVWFFNCCNSTRLWAKRQSKAVASVASL